VTWRTGLHYASITSYVSQAVRARLFYAKQTGKAVSCVSSRVSGVRRDKHAGLPQHKTAGLSPMVTLCRMPPCWTYPRGPAQDLPGFQQNQRLDKLLLCALL